MFSFKRKKQPDSNEELVLERSTNKNLKKLDKIYIIAACVLGLGWAVWNFGGIKLPKPDFSFIADYMAEIRASKNPPAILPQDSSMAANEDYIVYYSFGTNELYRMKRDGSENKKLASNVEMSAIRIKDDYVYFAQRDKGIMRAKMDGSEQTEVLPSSKKDFNYKIYGDYIYYRTSPDSYSRSSPDGKKNTVIKQSLTDNFFAVGNWIYEANIHDKTVYRFKPDSPKKEELFKFQNDARNFGVYRGYAYYIDMDNLIRCKLDGSDLKTIDNNVYSFTLEKDRLYYTKNFYDESKDTPDTELRYSFTVISSKPDGSEKKELFKQDSSFGQYIGGDIVYYNSSDEQAFIDLSSNESFPMPDPEYSVLVHNLGKKIGDYTPPEVIQGRQINMFMYKTPKSLYYNHRGNSSIFRYDVSKNEVTKLMDTPVMSFEPLGNLIFYINSGERGLFVLDTQTGTSEKVFDFMIDWYVPYAEGVYFTPGSRGLYRLSFSDNSITKVINKNINEIRRVGDYLYFTLPRDKSINRMKLTGGSYESVATLDNYSKYDIVDDYIYFYRAEDPEHGNVGSLLRKRIGSDTEETVIKYCMFDYFFNRDKIFFKLYSDDNGINAGFKVCSLDGTGVKALNINSESYFIDGETVYTVDYRGILEKLRLKDYVR